MKLFEKLRRSTEADSTTSLPEAPVDLDASATSAASSSAASGAPAITAPPASPAAAPAGHVVPDPGRYDPSHPCHAPVSGVDLVLFAQVTWRLRVASAEERGALLSDHGHTPETWSAVNTVWMARLGRMPYLCTTFDEASRRA